MTHAVDATAWGLEAFVAKLTPDGSNRIAKISSDGSSILWATLLGGSADDQALAVAVDATGYVAVAGNTRSVDFRTTNAWQASFGGAGGSTGRGDGFLTRLTPDGRSLVFSTYWGGAGDDWLAGVATDPAGNLVVAGGSGSTNLPVHAALQPWSAGGDADACIAKFTPEGENLFGS